jgi:hypothetical protein
MRRQHKWNTKQLLCKKSRHRHIPRMRMHNINRRKLLHLRQIQTERLKRRLVLPLRPVRNLRPGLATTHMKIAFVDGLLSPAIHLNLNRLRQLPAQIFNVNSSASVNIRRVLSCHQTNSHKASSFNINHVSASDRTERHHTHPHHTWRNRSFTGSPRRSPPAELYGIVCFRRCIRPMHVAAKAVQPVW